MDFNALKEKMKSANKKTEEAKKKEESGYQMDERLLNSHLVPNKNGTVSLIGRFLPQKDITNVPYVKDGTHYMRFGGRTEILPCLKYHTEDGKCEICDKKEPLWVEWNEKKDKAGGNKNHPSVRKVLDIINIFNPKEDIYINFFVKKYPDNKDIENKVFPYKMPLAINKMFSNQINPKDELSDKCFPYDLFEGRDIKLYGVPKTFPDSTGKDITFINYEDSEWQSISPIFMKDGQVDEKKTMKIVDQLIDLDEEGFVRKSEEVNVEEVKEKLKDFCEFLGDLLPENRTKSSNSVKDDYKESDNFEEFNEEVSEGDVNSSEEEHEEYDDFESSGSDISMDEIDELFDE